MICEKTTFVFPSLADVYYPIIEQGAYGNVEKTWMIDRSVAGNFITAGSRIKEEVEPNISVTQNMILISRVKSDLRKSSDGSLNAITNVVITNIRDSQSNEIYVETAGPRAGKSTIFEIATLEPQVGPFGSIEYYNVVLRRSENQAVNV